MKKPGLIKVLRSLPGCGKNILIDFLGKKVLGPELFYATSDLGKFWDVLTAVSKAYSNE